MPDTLLALEDVHTYYGDSHVLQGVSFGVPRGRVVALLGRNGAGKTTTLRSIMRLTPPKRGAMRFDGMPLDGLPAYRVARAGIALVHETRGIFPSLSVRENLTIAARAAPNGGGWTLDRVFETFPRLAERQNNGGYQLSGGEQQMLAIARALLTNPQLLLLDEPTEGLAPIIVEEIGRILERLKADGMTMLLVEQNFALATELADLSLVLGKGVIRWRGTSRDLRADDDVKRTWLGV
jgi:branched-chain amino acid transport system ATP-binding protein